MGFLIFLSLKTVADFNTKNFTTEGRKRSVSGVSRFNIRRNDE